jgi:GntR family transcriptional regulator/MocR family aminotransferase
MPLARVSQHWLSLDGDGSLREQLARALRRDILDGKLAPGERLPSTRTLAADLGVSRTTTQEAYDQLVAEGYLQSQRGSGTRVGELPATSERAPQSERATRQVPLSQWGRRLAEDFPYPYTALARARPVRYELLYGLPDVSGFPTQAWRRAVARRLESASLREHMYGDPCGHPRRREAIARHLAKARGVRAEPEDVIVFAGVQQALQLLARLLVDGGDRVLLEEPGYLGARHAFDAEGARAVPAPVDRDGVDLSRVPPHALRRCRLAYVTPSHQFPTGAVMSLARRLELLAWAQAEDAHVIEDDYDGAYRFDSRPIEPLQRLDGEGRVIYLGSFSKTMMPSLRLGYAVVPPSLRKPIESAKWLSDWSSPTLLQLALADFIEDGHYERHLRRSRLRLGRRRKSLIEAIERHLGDAAELEGTGAGLHLLLWLRRLAPGRLPELVVRAREEGVGIYPATPYYLGPAPRAGVLLGYALLDERQLGEAMKRLAHVLDHLDG